MRIARTPVKSFVALGVISSSAPRIALLAALQQLRPQLDIQLQEISPVISAGEPAYRVEVDVSGEASEPHSIDLWLQIKSAVMAKFPAGKPDAVTTIDP